MKVLLVLIGGFLVAVGFVVLIGLALPKRHAATRSAAFRSTPDQLFALIAGPQNWRPGVRSDGPTPGADGKIFERETDRWGKTITYQLLDVVPSASLKRRIATPNLPYSGTWTYSLQSQGDVTTVRITEEGEIYNPIFRFLSRFVIGQTRGIEDYLQALGTATHQQIQIAD